MNLKLALKKKLKYRPGVFILAMVSFLFFFNPQSNLAETKPESKKGKVRSTETAVSLRSDMRQIWTEYSIWKRNLILCLVDDLPGTDQTERRIFQNQEVIGNSIKPYFGIQAGDKFTELLVMHVFISEQVIRSSNDNNTGAVDEAICSTSLFICGCRSDVVCNKSNSDRQIKN